MMRNKKALYPLHHFIRIFCVMLCSLLLHESYLLGEESKGEKIQKKELKDEVSPPLLLRSEVDKARMTSTQELTFTITLDYRPGTEYSLPEIGGDIVGMRIVRFGSDGPKMEEDRVIFKKWYKLRPDISGSYVLPSLEITYTPAGASDKKTARTGEIFVEVLPPGGPAANKTNPQASSEADEMTDIIDIKPLIPKKIDWSLPLLVLGLSILLFGLGIFYWKKRKKSPPSEVSPPLPPHEEAIQRLQELEQGRFLEDGQHKYFHFTLSEVIRSYVEGQFSFPATDMTFEEIKGKISSLSLNEADDELKKDFLSLLNETDLVKYSDITLSPEKSMELLQKARTFVLKTRPNFTESGPESGSGSGSKEAAIEADNRRGPKAEEETVI